MQTPLIFFSAFIVVLLLIALATWLVRKFGGSRLGSNGARGRAPRLAVIDATAVDTRRRLVLVRRDNVEHLIMIGGPTDIVVESSIIRSPNGAREPSVRGPASEGAARHQDALPAPEPEAYQDYDQRLPEPTARPQARDATFGDELRRAAPQAAPVVPAMERRPEPVAPIIPQRAEPRIEPQPSRSLPRSEAAPQRSEPILGRAPPRMPGLDSLRNPSRAEPAPVAPPVAAPASAAPSLTTRDALSEADQNLADMAQRLEAALRKPAPPQQRAPAPNPEPAPAWPGSPRPAPAPSAQSVKSGFENLEDEMASLLGRPKNPS